LNDRITNPLVASAIQTSILTNSGKIEFKDQKFSADVSAVEFLNHLFVRLVAKDRRFTSVNFRYSTFDACYLRKCVFEDCDFTGCRFVGTNLSGSAFAGCKFDYATFERTDIDDQVLSDECPGNENLKLRFARSLRVNYQQLGDVDAVNHAIAVELEATCVHLKKSWRSNESYYRRKYSGKRRVLQWARWVRFKVLDWIWGNGENVWKLLRAALLVVAAVGVVQAVIFSDPKDGHRYWAAAIEAPTVFLGVDAPGNYPKLYLTAIVFARLVLFGFFMAIIIKRLNRR